MKYRKDLIAFLSSLLLVASTRMIPHADNFTPMEAVVLFGAVFYTRRIFAFIMPLLLMYGFDFVINNTIARPFFPDQQGVIWFSDYMIYNAISYLIITAIGFTLLKQLKFSHVGLGSVLSAGVFFLISNFGAWLGSTLYPANAEGLWMSYVAGIPFLKSSLISTFLFSSIFYFSIRFYEKMITKSVVIGSQKP